jgi:hypothetical protein
MEICWALLQDPGEDNNSGDESDEVGIDNTDDIDVIHHPHNVDLGDTEDPPQPNNDCADTALSDWESSFMAGFSALERRQQQLENISPGGEWPYQLSLIFLPDGPDPDVVRLSAGSSATPLVAKHRVATVAWTMPSVNKGSIILLPDSQYNNTVMALNPACPKLSNIRSFDMILPVIGLRPHRSKDRPPLPDLPLRLKTMWMTAANNRASQECESLSLDYCVWCKGGGAFDSENKTGAPGASLFEALTEPVSVCAFCLRVCHFECSVKAAKAQAEYFKCFNPSSDSLSALPDIFKNTGGGYHVICGMCSAALSLLNVFGTEDDE